MSCVRLRLLTLALVLAAAAAGCGGRAAPADSGIEGRVLIGPMCPVVQEGVPCPDEPYEATIRVRDESGEVVATVRSAADGRFRVDLVPGRYVLEPVAPNEGAPPYAGPLEVQVAAHAFTPVTITYDSGIR
jgi:hypothetical protein